MSPGERIDGPLGAFYVPSEPPETRRICIALSRGVWGYPGSYDRPEARIPEYEHEALSIPGVRRILDVGAGWGAFAVWAVQRWGADIEIDCYEPSEAAAGFILRNVDVLPIAGQGFVLRIHRAAVSARADIVLGHSDDWGSRKTHAIDEGRAGDKVATIRPHDLPPCDVLKCDAEGIEPELFEHYKHLSTLKAAIYEWHSPADRSTLRAILASTGMRCVRDEDGPWGGGNGVGVWVR